MKRTLYGLGGLLAAGTMAATGPAALAAQHPQPHPQPGNREATVTQVSVHQYRGYEQVQFDFRGPLPAHDAAAYVRRLIGDPSGTPIPPKGNATLRITFQPAYATQQAERTITLYRGNVEQVKLAGNFRGSVSYDIGLAKATRYTMHTASTRHRAQVDVDLWAPRHR